MVRTYEWFRGLLRTRSGLRLTVTAAVLLCFIRTDAEGIKGTEGFPRGHRTQTVFAYFRRMLRWALLFLTDHSRMPGTTTRGQSGVLHLLGLISGVRRRGSPFRPWTLVVEMDLLPARRLKAASLPHCRPDGRH